MSGSELQHPIQGKVRFNFEQLAGKVTTIKHLQQLKSRLGSPVQNDCWAELGVISQAT